MPPPAPAPKNGSAIKAGNTWSRQPQNPGINFTQNA